VPQTRKRLILIARRGLWRIQRPHPTHRNGGDMFHARWRGWYAAIEDILHTLPPTKPAPWQAARLPKELRESTLIGAGGYEGDIVSRVADDPTFTITHGGNGNSQQLRAYLVASNSGPESWGDNTRADDEPAHTTTTNALGRARAYIVGGGNTQLSQIDSRARPDDAPMFTVSASDGARKTAAAYLLDGDNARSDTGEPIMRAADEPAMAMRATRATVHRAHISGQWVRMTIQALGRFQTVPDSYQGLTSEINGNGVPCDFAEAIMRSL
jgi:site-specific DNA-cytosine methylase